jgi:hypothetical protein
MTQPTDELEDKRRPWAKFLALMGALLFLILMLWHVDPDPSSGLFQSPPEATATSAQATATEVLTPTATLTPTVTLTPPLRQTQPPAATAETVTAEPSVTPLEQTPTESPSPLPSLTPTPGTGEDEGTGRYAQGDEGFVFEWGTLFDSFALGASYVWLCCGVFLLVLVPISFLALWVASKRRSQNDS